MALDGIPLPEMRKRMGRFLDALGLRTELQGLAASTTYYLPQQGAQVGGFSSVDYGGERVRSMRREWADELINMWVCMYSL